VTLPRTFEDVEGPWVEPARESGLIRRCRDYWTIPVNQMPNAALAMLLRQRIALPLIVPEARRRLSAPFADDSELYEGELADALKKAGG
jgi:hypothetical protein